MSISTDTTHSFQIIHGRVVTPTHVIENGTVQVQDQIITYVGSTANAPMWQHQTTYDAQGGLVIPGFIDIHVHGGMGADFMDADPQVLDTITTFHASQGTTAILATTMTAPHADIEHVLEQVYNYINHGQMPGAQIEGVHLEGPFISPKWPGAQNPEHIVLPNIEWLEQWEARYPGLIKQLTLAPEREGALLLIPWLRQHGITAAAGHTDASYEEIMEAVAVGLNHAVHTFNAMTPLHHRKPGVAGAVLSTPAIHAEVIADGIHVHPAAVSLLAQLKQNNNLILITDAMSAAGLGDGQYMLGDQPVNVINGIATLPDDSGTLAGSRLTMIEGFCFLIQQAGLSIMQASAAASGNPARELGLYEQTGSLDIGKRADILVLNPEMELQHIFIKGLLKSYR